MTCEISELKETAVQFGASQFFARGVKPESGRRCPHCDSIIYSRRHKRCGVCNELLPAAYVFSVEQAQRVESLLEEERQRHRLWLRRMNFGA